MKSQFSEYQRDAIKAFRCVHCNSPMKVHVSDLTCSSCGRRYPVRKDGIIDVSKGLPKRLSIAQRVGRWKIASKHYDALWRRHALTVLTRRPFTPAEELRIVGGNLSLSSARIVLDNATGNAFYGRRLAQLMERQEHGGVVVANDTSMEMLNQARKLAVQDGVAHRILFVRSDSEDMPFLDKSIDGVVCGGTFNEFTCPEQVLGEFRRIMTPHAKVSMMFQVLSGNGVIARAQKFLGILLGLQFQSADDALNMLSKYFTPTVLAYEGIIIIAGLSIPESSRQDRAGVLKQRSRVNGNSLKIRRGKAWNREKISL